jgi:hypothetical protein
MMHDRAVGRAKLQRAHVALGRLREGNYEVAKDVVVARLQRVRVRHADDQVRFAELPAGRDRRRGGGVGGITFGRSGLDPP